MSTAWGFELALRDIQEGEEITDEYSLFNLEWEMDCCCGALRCRGVIRPDDAWMHFRRWDRLLKSAIQAVSLVEQPLIGCLDLETRNSLERYLRGDAKYRSVRSLIRKRDEECRVA